MKMNYIVKVAKNLTHNQNNNFMLVTVGDTGSGKSYANLSLGMMLDEDFGIDRICFRAKEFLEVINSDLPKGSVVMFDEAGVDVSSREWYTKKNKLIKDTVDTFRRDNLICLWTTPSLMGIDSQVRSKFDAVMLMIEKGKGQYKNIVTDHIKGQNYYKYPSWRGGKLEGKTEKGQYWNIKIPDPRDVEQNMGKTGLVKEYEDNKELFTEEVKKDSMDEFTEDVDNEITLGTRDLAGMIVNRAQEFKLDDELSDNKLKKFVISKLKSEYPSINFKKSDVDEAVVFARYERTRAKEILADPIEKKKSEGEREEDVDFPIEYLPTVKKMRTGDDVYSLEEITSRLNVKFTNFYRVYRKVKDYIEGDKQDQFYEKYQEWLDEGL